MKKENVEFYMQDNFYLQTFGLLQNCTSETVQVYG